MNEPDALELVKLTMANGRVIYQAVDYQTLENIRQTAKEFIFLHTPEIRFTVEHLGQVFLYPPNWMRKAIAEEYSWREL